MEKYKFFDSTPGDQRQYNAADFAEVFNSMMTTGVYKGSGDDPEPAFNPRKHYENSDDSFMVGPGKAIINGYHYHNDGLEGFAVPAPGLEDRIDSVVLRLDRRMEERSIKLMYKEGIPATPPAPPELQRDDFVYELAIANISVTTTDGSISGAVIYDENITNVVGDPYSCPWVEAPGAQAQADQAEEDAINWAKGFGLGTSAVNYTGDLNDLVKPGFHYASSAATNKPKNTNFYVIVQPHEDPLFLSQIAIDNQTGIIYTRVKHQGIWKAWIEFALEDSKTRLNMHAGKSANQSIAAATMTKISWNVWVANTPNQRNQAQFSLPNGRFTAPKDGIYSINAMVRFDLAQYQAGELYLFKNGAQWGMMDKVVAPGAANLATHAVIDIPLLAGDYLELHGFSSTATQALANAYFAVAQLTQ